MIVELIGGSRLHPRLRIHTLGLWWRDHEDAALLVVIAVTLILRLWNLSDVPPLYSDEGNNGHLALQIFRGEQLPLRGVTPHFGALTHYITAAFFSLFGGSVFTARLVPALSSVGATIVAFFWARELGGRRGALLTGLLMAVSGWMTIYGRIAWEMGPNILFVTIAFLAAYRTMCRGDARWAMTTGLAIGAAANGHLYLIILIIPCILAILTGEHPWRRKIVLGALVFFCALALLIPLFIASELHSRDLFSNYQAAYDETGLSPEPITPRSALLDIMGFTATVTATAGGALRFAIPAAFVWLLWQSWRRRTPTTSFFFIVLLFILVFAPHVLGPVRPGSYAAPLCERMTAWFGRDHCMLSRARYLDILYPLPLVILGWATAMVTRRQPWIYCLAIVLLVGPLVPQTLAFVTTVHPQRVGAVRPLIEMLEDDACIVVHSANRDVVRLSLLAGTRRRVYTPEGYRHAQPPCRVLYVISAYVPLTGPQLTPVHTVTIEGTPTWYLYRVSDPPIDDVLCPSRWFRSEETGPRNLVGWTRQEHEVFSCNEGICTGHWRWAVASPLQGIRLHILADCRITRTSSPLEISTDGGQTWTESCTKAKETFPPTRWVDTGIAVTAPDRTPVDILFRATKRDELEANTVAELRLCPNAPINVETLINTSIPARWCETSCSP